MDGKEYPVSEAVRLIGVESHVLRYWEDELSIEIQRNSQGHRVYSEENIALFRCVKELKEKGLQLKAIRLLMEENGGFGTDPDAQDGGFAGRLRELAGAYVSGGQSGERGEAQEEEGQAEAEEVRCEIVPLQEPGDNMYRFRQILRRLIEEVVTEQNGKLEEALAERMKEELEDFYLQYCRIMQEAAASAGPESRKRGRVRRALRRLLGLE